MSISHQYRGRVFLNSHDYDHALSEFEAALQVEKNIWKSLGSHSKPLSPTGNSFTKVELINKYSLAQYRSEYAELHFLLGIVYLAQHDSQRAITKFKVSLQMQPHFLDARIALAELYLQLGRIAEARKEFAAALMDIRQSSVYIP